MPKNIEDIIPSGKKSIRDIPIPIRRVERRAVKRVSEASAEEPRALPRLNDIETREYRENTRKPRRLGKWLGGAIGALVVALAALVLTSGATLSYIPKTAELDFDNDVYTAHQTPSGGQLPFSIIKLSGEKSIDVPATGEETVTEKARGTVIIYNEQSTAQPLVKTTRLETGDGKIYRIPADITVPAKGSVETTAIADQPGTAGNIGLSDFTLPGLKGTPRYELVYARSKTAMTGGFSGTRKKVSEADLTNAKTELEEALRTDLLAQARAQMPSDFILFPDLASVTYELLPVENSGQTAAKVTESGNLSAVIFKRGDLAQYLAMEKLGANNLGSEVEIPDWSEVGISLAGNGSTALGADTIRIEVNGSAIVRYITDEASLAGDLAGTLKSDLNDVLRKYPSIESAGATIRPFWKQAFPDDPTKIKIVREQ